MPDATVETIEEFRSRLRAWLADNFPRATRPGFGMSMAQGQLSDEEELEEVAHHRDLQRRLFDGGFAGICWPKEYGGQGLTPAYQEVFNQEIWPYEWPARFQVPTLQPCATVLLDFGTEEQKREHLPAILRGDEIWMQMLSEPTGGSDVAGAQTTAVRDGDEWVLNGSKIWTTGAWWADWALCLARTNWDVPKHRGLSVFMLRIHQPNIEVHRIEMLNGSTRVLPGVPHRRAGTRLRSRRRDRSGLDGRHAVDVLRAELRDVAAHHPADSTGGGRRGRRGHDAGPGSEPHPRGAAGRTPRRRRDPRAHR